MLLGGAGCGASIGDEAPQEWPEERSPGGGDGGRMASAVPAPVPGAGFAPDPRNLLSGVFSPHLVHAVDIRVAPEHIPTLAGSSRTRVPCTFTYDGVTIENAGIRRKGFIGSSRPLDKKSGFSVDFNEFVKGQRLGGLKKIILNNAVQDPSFLNEHVGYEVYRMMGQPAPFTAHAHVTLNGTPYGIYVVKEAINKDFLARNFGATNAEGNLYEGTYPFDIGDSARGLQLKNRVEEMRSPADAEAFVRLIKETPDATWEEVVGARLDLSRFITAHALDAVLNHVDGYFWGPNNYYVYNDPGAGKWVFIPHGMDGLFESYRDPFRQPRGKLAVRLRSLPELDRRVQQEVRRVIAALDVKALHSRVDRVAAILQALSPSDSRTKSDVASFMSRLPRVKTALETRSALVSAERRPGEGTGLTGQYFNDPDLMDLKLTRVDPEVRFDWPRSPDPSLGDDRFSVRWTGQIQPEHSETYTLHAVADDGVRLWIDGQLLIDRWAARALTEHRATIAFVAGRRYDLRLEYFDHASSSVILLHWSSPTRPREPVPSFRLFPSWSAAAPR